MEHSHKQLKFNNLKRIENEKSNNERIALAVISMTIGFVGCKKEKDTTIPESTKLDFESFKEYGNIHNDFLSNAKEVFSIDSSVRTLDEGIDYINKINMEYASKMKIDINEKNVLMNHLEKNKRFLNTSGFYEELFISSLKDSGDTIAQYFESAEQAYDLGILDDFEVRSINLIGQMAKDSHEGLISNDEMKCKLLEIKDEWIAKGYTTDSDNGYALAITLSISLASLEWWEANPEAFGDGNEAKALPAWVAADVVGAGYSAVVAGIAGYSTTGQVNWGSVGIAACAGAVSGSTGIIGKAGKWIASLL